MNNRHLYTLAAVLTALALALFAYKVRVLGFPLVPEEQTEIWTIEAAVNFDPGPAAVKATLRIPGLTPGFALLDENFVSRGFGLTTRNIPAGREAQWAVRQASGRQALYYRALVYRDSRIAEDTTPPFPAPPVLDEASRVAMEGLIADVRRQSADVASFTTELLRRINAGESDQYVSLFLRKGSTAAQHAQLATVLLAGAQIPARVAYGVPLRREAGSVKAEPFTASLEGTGRLWDANTGKALGQPMHLGGQFETAEFSPDGRTLAIGGWDEQSRGTARLWKVPQPLPDKPALLHAWAKARTGLQWQRSGFIRRLSQADWLMARDDLKKLYGKMDLPPNSN